MHHSQEWIKLTECIVYKLAEPTPEEIWKQSWGPCPDKYWIKITELSPLLKKRSQKNNLQQSLNESASGRCASGKDKW